MRHFSDSIVLPSLARITQGDTVFFLVCLMFMILICLDYLVEIVSAVFSMSGMTSCFVTDDFP